MAVGIYPDICECGPVIVLRVYSLSLTIPFINYVLSFEALVTQSILGAVVMWLSVGGEGVRRASSLNQFGTKANELSI